MATVDLARDQLAEVYANRHWRTDAGVEAIYYLPEKAPDREIRLVEVNREVTSLEGLPIEPMDFGIDANGESFYRLLVLDLSPAQWHRICENEISLPAGWTLKGAVSCLRPSDE